MDKDDLQMPKGRDDPHVSLDQAVFVLLVAPDGWANGIDGITDVTLYPVIAAKLRQWATIFDKRTENFVTKQ